MEWLRGGFVLAVLFTVVLPLNHMAGLRHTLLVIGFVLTFWQGVSFRAPALPVKWPLLAWVVVAGLSASWSLDRIFTLREFKLEVLLGLMAFWLMYCSCQSLNKMWLLMRAITLATVITVFVSIYQIWLLGGHDFHWNSNNNDPWEWVHGFVSYSTYLVLVFPVLFYMFLRGGWLGRWLGIVAMLLVFLAGWATQNRMFWVALVLALSLGAGLWYAKYLPRLRSRWLPLIMMGVGLVVLIIGFALVARDRPANALAANTGGIFEILLHTFTQSERFLIWQYWLGAAQEHLWLGVGFGRDLPHMVFPKPADWPVLMFAHAHNVFIDVLLQLGVVGLSVFVILLGSLMKRFWKYYRSNSEELVWLGMLGLTILVAFASKNFTDDMFWRTDALVFWSLMGLILGAGERILKGPQLQ